MKRILIAAFLLACVLLGARERTYVSAYLCSYPGTAWEAVKAPVKWDRGDWLTAAGLVGLGAGLYFVEEDIADWTGELGTGKAGELISLPGENYVALPAVGAVILAGWWGDDPRTLDTGLLCLKSLLLADTATYGLKWLAQRERPSAGRGNGFFSGEGFARERDSFPSGHATVVWALAPVLVEQYPDSAWVAPLAYGTASLVSLSRLAGNKHWASDVLAGSLIGYCSARLTLKGTPRLLCWPDPLSGGVAFRLQF